jgi:hypothetical protein
MRNGGDRGDAIVAFGNPSMVGVASGVYEYVYAGCRCRIKI